MPQLNHQSRTSAPHRPPKNVTSAVASAQKHVSAAEYRQRFCPAETSEKSAAKGRHNQRNGRDFEALLKVACEKYRDDKIAKGEEWQP